MRTRAAVPRNAGTPWAVTGLELVLPTANEALARPEAAGLRRCHQHVRARPAARLPMAAGHEAASGIVSAGPWRASGKPGEHAPCCRTPVRGPRCCPGSRDHVPVRLVSRGDATGATTAQGTRPASPPSARSGPGVRKYALDEINEGYHDLMDGKNIRGAIVHQHENATRIVRQGKVG